MMSEREKRTLNRDLLRQTAEHLGSLAEQAKEAHDLAQRYDASRGKRIRIQTWDRYAKLSRLSKELLEIVHE